MDRTYMSETPYQSLKAKAFWSPAVAKRNLFDIAELWSAPFPITQETRISTFGSCFAQHFSRALVARGFKWIDAEPAPRGLSVTYAKAFNYGVFSARTGNIYTTSLLKQWTEWALGHSQPPKIYWEAKGRFYDPFRPVVEPDGFGSLDEMLASRAHTIAAFRRSIMDCDLLVFTLGLTESWWDVKTGIEFPMCPGTIAGEFDAKQHVFKNQDYPFVQKNLIDAIEMIRSARSDGPAFLLTVSPVPLTATNSGNHVLVATMESKSVLRAVAGQSAREDKNISYFPSYEIINAPPYRATFFEPNMRSVNISGVNHVMKTFFTGLTDATVEESTSIDNDAPTPQDNSPRNSDDLACEEELLAAFGSQP
jgi:hypothetical protein